MVKPKCIWEPELTIFYFDHPVIVKEAGANNEKMCIITTDLLSRLVADFNFHGLSFF